MKVNNNKIKLPKWLANMRFSVVSKVVLSVYVIAGLVIYLTTIHKREVNTVHYKTTLKNVVQK